MRTKEQLYEAADKIKSLGFRVWIPTDSVNRGFYYGYYSDGKSVAGFSLGYFFGVRWSTINAPGSHGVGTGFSCEDEGVPVAELTAERLREGFLSIPPWYRMQKNDKVVKFKDLDEWLAFQAKQTWHHIEEYKPEQV